MKKITQKQINEKLKEMKNAKKEFDKVSNEWLNNGGSWAKCEQAYKTFETIRNELSVMFERRSAYNG